MEIRKLEALRHKLYKKRNERMQQVGSPAYKSLIENIKEVELKIKGLKEMKNFEDAVTGEFKKLSRLAGQQEDKAKAYSFLSHISLSLIAQIMDAMKIDTFEINESEFTYKASKIPAEINQIMKDITSEAQKELTKNNVKH